MTTGSVAQAMSTAIGYAFAPKYLGKQSRTYLVLGDGEGHEGQVWEGALFAAQRKLSNLIAFVDMNKKQLDGFTADICNPGDLAQKFRDFGWNAQDCDGNDVESLQIAIQLAWRQSDKPSMIIMHTEKGAGCTFAEGVLYNHHMKFSDADYAKAVVDLEARHEALENTGAVPSPN